MRHPATGTGAAPRRAAYTLVELLVVIAIIAVLASLTTAAAMMMITLQHERSTKFTMRQIEGARKKHWDAVVKSALEENMDTPENAAAISLIRQWAGDEKRTRVMYIKFRLKQEFPTSYAEALNPAPLPPKKNYTKYLNNLGITTVTNPLTATPVAHESAACLYMALSEGTSGVKTNLDQLNVGVKSFDTPNTPTTGQTIKAVVDDWGNPLVFARWPTGDPALDLLTPINNSKLRDLEDRDGLLISSTFYGTPGRVQFETWGHSLTKNNAAHAYYLVPVLVSGGRDGKTGILTDGKLTVNSAADAKDNIYSYNLERE
jgi:prepilin-type N-terminal cleavage/methylation domain-containing protein